MREIRGEHDIYFYDKTISLIERETDAILVAGMGQMLTESDAANFHSLYPS